MRAIWSQGNSTLPILKYNIIWWILNRQNQARDALLKIQIPCWPHLQVITDPCIIHSTTPHGLFFADTPVILFLHGQKFSSENWVNLGTLKLMNSIGYRTAAIDLPGHGKTRDLPYIDNNMRAEFLKTAFDFFGNGSNLTAVGAVLVSPSMSG